eukprot:4108610-Amphidinium_carterae.2
MAAEWRYSLSVLSHLGPIIVLTCDPHACTDYRQACPTPKTPSSPLLSTKPIRLSKWQHKLIVHLTTVTKTKGDPNLVEQRRPTSTL